jgi:hypothetical protein
MKLPGRLTALVPALLLAACATTWVRVDDSAAHYQDAHYSVTLPAGWMQLRSDDTLILSRDGILLQLISIEYRPHAEAFEHIGKASSPTMLPSELAELAIADFEAAQEGGLPSLEILRNAPVGIAGLTGFDIHLRYKTDDGLRKDKLLRGVANESGFYLISYIAPTLHYFERDRQVYESLTDSLQL